MSFHQYFFPEMTAADLSCPIAKASSMSKHCYTNGAQIEDFITSNTERFGTRRVNNGAIYQPLVEAKEIRILEIQPAPFNANITCKLHHCFIDFEYTFHPQTRLLPRSQALSITGEPLWYTTLSYIWGPPDFTSVISCNGHNRRITPNLESAIRHLRSDTDAVHLWIDQLCINQDDKVEKARQVQLMGSIYKRAYSTIIWLGEDSAKIAIELLQGVHEEWKFAADELPVEQLEVYKLPCSTSEAWWHLSNLFNRPWFKRLWIIQEAILSHPSYVMTGSYIVPWSQFSTPCGTALDSGFMNWLEKKECQNIAPGVSSVNSACRIAWELSNSADSFHQFQMQPKLLAVLVYSRYADATDARDKVYGALGICSSNIEVDYNLSAHEIYRRATVSILKEELCLFAATEATNVNHGIITICV